MIVHDVTPDSASVTAAEAPIVRTRGLTKRFTEVGPAAVDALDLDVQPGEILCLLGPSGCGKTTLLRLIAGFESPDGGTVEVAGREVASATRQVRPEKRRIGFVFQDFALFPHLNVIDNVTFGLKGSAASRAARAEEMLDLVGMSVFRTRFPHQLSGGQQQRVALARALAPEPHILLLDEPFSNLDASLRGSTREEVRTILERTGTTTIMVTHDQEEALSFGDRLAVMRYGKVEQIGRPEEVYFNPNTAFVALFLGRTNLLRGSVAEGVAATSIGPVPVTGPAKGQALVSLRPDHLQLTAAAPGAALPAASGVHVRVMKREFKGHVIAYEVAQAQADAQEGEKADERLVVYGAPTADLAVGDAAWLTVTGAGVPLRAGVTGG